MRLFFATWPDSTAATALADLAHRLAERTGGKAVPVAKIHLTLAFLGDVDEGRLEAAVSAAAGLRCGSFELLLDEVGSFRGARVAWAGCSQPAQELIELQSRLSEALRAKGFVPEERPFAPHLTLVRKVARPIGRQATPPIRWGARELTLVRSELGKGSYSTLARWDLG
jgi:2'-5' RNA ligase